MEATFVESVWVGGADTSLKGTGRVESKDGTGQRMDNSPLPRTLPKNIGVVVADLSWGHLLLGDKKRSLSEPWEIVKKSRAPQYPTCPSHAIWMSTLPEGAEFCSNATCH